MQNKEIELKFGFDGDAKNLYSIFSNIGSVSNETELHLDNTYFDTDKRDLFALKAGLRIRRGDNFSEQTLKVKGENIGGLHKRSEYNLPIEDSALVPNLLKFPKEAFPENYDIDSVQANLKSVCRINFTRYLFNLELLDSVFEVAYDHGYIQVDEEYQYPLNELEIELKESKVKSDDLLNLFSILCNYLASNNLPLLLEPFSKMHRASLLQHTSKPSLDIVARDNNASLVDYVTSLVASFENLYGHYLITHEVTLFGQICVLLENMILALKQLSHRNFLAFIKGQKEPVEYKDDLMIILRLVKAFYKVCSHTQKRMLLCRLKGNEKGIEACFDKVRASEKTNKMFLIPLKLRLLLSLIAK
jgi:inorganic triphosphatase YgiF